MDRRPLLLLALVCAACASTAPSPATLPAAPAIASASQTSDAGEFRKDLEEAYARIVARETARPQSAPAVDLEAAASIPIPDNRFVRNAVALFSGNLRSDIQTYLTRSAKYKKMIDRALTDAGLPKALAYLPVIESGYSPTLTSSVGARGVWQFMSETAREYGLRVDWWVDERADPERSTRAAALYLKDLYREFNDWPLTLAAYNAGPGRIRRALSTSGGATFWDLYEAAAIPKETRGYVPTFYATLLIASDPATYGFQLAQPDDPEIRRVEIEGPVSLGTIAEAAGVDPDMLRSMNPAFRRGVLPPGRSAVRIPARAAETIASRAATLKNDDAEIEVCSFTLREGDSLRRLARLMGVKVETLVAMNDLRSPDAAGAGDSVYLPVRARDLGAILQQQNIEYAVQKGDTLFSIAKKHNLTVEELRDLNDLPRGESLHRGQRLRVNAPRGLSAGGM
jgi:membrane-bound lytic murein transglycosylase D